jgi:hypothetical protein
MQINGAQDSVMTGGSASSAWASPQLSLVTRLSILAIRDFVTFLQAMNFQQIKYS